MCSLRCRSPARPTPCAGARCPCPTRRARRPRPKPRRGEKAKPVEKPVAPAISAAEALDRIDLPDEALQRIGNAWKPGASLVVSDQGLGDETGRGTDFIVVTR